MHTRDIIVIGGSAGSGAVLKRLLNSLPPDLPASVFITTHVPAQGSLLTEMLKAASALPVHTAIDGMPTERGHVYLPVPDRHMLLIDSTIRLGHGPRENMVRPAIDPLFRSAAFSYGPRAVGVILTGYLNDGAAGLKAIKRCGGLAVVQHPMDAEASQMPRSALEAVDTDHVVIADDLPELLSNIVRERAPERHPPPRDIELEIRIAAGVRVGDEVFRSLAEPSPLTCPECHGVLSEVKGEGPLRYRCQIGHAMTAEVAFAEQQKEVDQALHIALRMMEERLNLVDRMAREAEEQGRSAVAELYGARAEEYRGYADTLRQAALLSLRTIHELEEEDA